MTVDSLLFVRFIFDPRKGCPVITIWKAFNWLIVYGMEWYEEEMIAFKVF